MNKKSSTPINTLIFSQSNNDSEQLASQLKNQGLPIRHSIISNSESLNENLEQKQWQLALILEQSENFSLDQIMAQLRKQNYEIPSIFITASYNEASRETVLSKGVSDCIGAQQNNLLGILIRREQRLVQSQQQLQVAQKEVAETSKRNQLLLDSSKDAIAYIHEGMHIYTNPTYSERFGYEADDLIVSTIMDLIASEDTQKIKDLLKQQAKSGEEVSEVLHGKTQSGETFEANFIISSALYDDEHCIQLLVRETMDNSELEKRLREASELDPVTNLYNRPAMINALQESVKASQSTGLDSLLYYIDIDDYSVYQQEFGIAACDELLIGIGDWLRETTPDSAKVGRISDSSFCILLSNSDAMPSELARNLCSSVKSHSFEAAGQTLKITVSVGVVSTIDNTLSSAKLLAHANTVSQKVRDDGGDDFKIFNPSIDSLLNEREIKQYEEFQTARESKNLTLFFQPMLALKGSANKQYFSFLRYKNANNEWTLGSNIFGIFEKLGIDEEIDRIAINHCLSVLQKQEAGYNIFVNIGASTLLRDDLVQWLSDKLEASKVKPEQIILSVNNQIAQSYLNRLLTLKSALASINVSLCISRLDIDDKELISTIEPDFIALSSQLIKNVKQDGTEKLSNLIHIAGNSEVKTIVNQIEDASVLAMIWPLGIDFAMGNYVSKPLPVLSYDFSEGAF